MERSMELKVGALLLLALFVLGGFVLALADFQLSGGLEISVDYAFSGAIQAGAPVKVSGVRVGRVRRLEFVGGQADPGAEDIQVRLVLSLEERARPVLHQGARFYVNTQGLLGEHYVELVPARTPGPPLPEGAKLRGVDPPRMDLLVQRIYDLLDALSGLLQKDEGQLAELVRSGASLAHTLNEVVSEHRTELSGTLRSARVAADEAAALLQGLHRAVGDGTEARRTLADAAQTTELLKKELPAILENLKKTLVNLESLGETLRHVKPEHVDQIVGHTVALTGNLDRLVADARSLTERVRSGGGTVGLLLADDEIYDDLKELLRDLKQHPWKLVWKQ